MQTVLREVEDYRKNEGGYNLRCCPASRLRSGTVNNDDSAAPAILEPRDKVLANIANMYKVTSFLTLSGLVFSFSALMTGFPALVKHLGIRGIQLREVLVLLRFDRDSQDQVEGGIVE